MLNTSARLLRLLTLLETRRDWSGAQLAERLEVSTRTVRNDVARLRELGYPVEAAPGVAGGYRLGSGAAMPPLLLDDLEAGAFRVDRMQVQRPTGPHFTPRELPAEDIAAYVTRSVRSAPQRYEARVIVKAPADVIAERVPRAIAVEPIDDNTCAVLARSNSVEMLALYLGMLDADFVVTDPPELVARMSTLAGRYAAAANAG